MLHASLRWRWTHTVSLWPYALCMAVNVMNTTPPRKHGKNQWPIKIFALVSVRPELQNFHAFGCPVYVLNAPLQTGQLQSKWMSQAWLGIYLGMSPRHERIVALALNPRPGLVSPQWHVKFDNNFDTVSKTSDKTHALWKKQAGFVTIGMKDPESQIRQQVQNLQTPNLPTMANNNVSARFNILGLEDSAIWINGELLHAPPEGASPAQDLGYDINFGDSNNKEQLHNMEFGTSALTPKRCTILCGFSPEQGTKALFYCQKKLLLNATPTLTSVVYGIGTRLNKIR
jgi:hypothetical protein